MRLQFLGAAGTVTGSCFLLECGNKRIMIDCGMFQGPKEIRERNYGNFPVQPKTVDYLLLTHAHIDHSGLIPKLVKHGFRGQIFATPPTVALCQYLLPDSGHIQEVEVERKNRKYRRAGMDLIEPIYTVDEAYKSLSYFKLAVYDEIVQITPDIKARFVDAGHILGSAIIELWVGENGAETKLVFSGDLGNKNRPLVKNPTPVKEADYVIMESTYGSRLHQQCENEIELLHNVIWETYKKGGNLIIPAFAVERTQDLLYHLSMLYEAKRMPPMTVYIDSPLATAVTTVFQKNREFFDKEALEIAMKGGDPVNFPGLKFTQSVQESMSLNNTSGAIIISASGMCEAGRIRHHLKYNLWRPESTVLFVGYQAEGTIGRLILDGETSVRIFGEDIAVKADVRYIECYSAHADQAGLIEWVKNFQKPPREVFIVHGERESSDALVGLLKTELGLNASVAEWRQVVELQPAVAEEDMIKSRCVSLADKLYNLLTKSTDRAQKEELLSRLNDLENFVEKGIKKAV